MNKIRSCISNFFRLFTAIGIVFTTWKVARGWPAGNAGKNNCAHDVSVKSNQEKPEKKAVAQKAGTEGDQGETHGKVIDAKRRPSKVK